MGPYIPRKQRALWALGGTLMIFTGCFYFVFSAGATDAPTVSFAARGNAEADNIRCVTQSLHTTLSRTPLTFYGRCTPDQKTSAQKKLERDLRALVAGHPIEAMIPAIAQHDRAIAAFLIGIAKKESNWGKRAPSKNRQDCYNYWGYKGKGGRGIAMGHGCFASPEEAVAIVGKRITELVYDYGRTTPEKMIIWKCGRSCAGHGKADVAKWISDVELYHDKVVRTADSF